MTAKRKCERCKGFAGEKGRLTPQTIGDRTLQVCGNCMMFRDLLGWSLTKRCALAFSKHASAFEKSAA